MSIVADSREKNAALLAAADERRFLSQPNPLDPGHPFSFDAEVTTKCGEVWRFEMKWSAEDAISSWLNREDGEAGHSKLWRQTRYVDALICVWSDLEIELAFPPERRPAIKGMKNRLATWALQGKPPVIFFSDASDVIAWFRYLEKQKMPLRDSPTPISMLVPSEA